MLFYASILSQMPMLRRIFRCIGPNQKNQPHLDLYLVRRYTICHFPIGVLYLCICQNQKNQPNLVLYLSQPWQMHVQGSNLLFNHPICHYLSAMDKKAQNAAHYRIMDSLELTIDTCLQWRVILTLRPPSVTLSSEPGMKWKLACKFVNTCHITILVYTLPSWSALADRYRTNVTTLTVKKNRAWCIIKYIDWHSTWSMCFISQDLSSPEGTLSQVTCSLYSMLWILIYHRCTLWPWSSLLRTVSCILWN